MTQLDQPHGLGRVDDIMALQASTLVGDVRDLLLQEARDVKEVLPWTSRSEREQQDIIDRVDRFSRDMVRRTIELVIGDEHPSVRATVDSWTVKDGLKIVLKAAAAPAHIEALTNGTSLPLLVFAGMEDVAGERAPITPLKDEPPLIDPDDDGPVFDQTDAGR